MSDLRILMGDCREGMRGMDAGSVQACVTSPPYWALRDYGVPPTQWEACEFTPMAGLPPVQIPAMECCLGLEPDPLAFVGHMVLVFREVWRVLRDDGVLFMNFGDSAAPSGGAGNQGNGARHGRRHTQTNLKQGFGGGLKPKDIVMMPARVALALQADGWTVRQDIIWHKPNPMPESAKDRCTKAHEYIYLMSKGPRYYWDHEAMREPAIWAGSGRESKTRGQFAGKTEAMPGRNAFRAITTTRNKRSVWTVKPQPYPEAHFATYPEELVRPCVLAATSSKGCCPHCGAPWERIVEKGEPDREYQKACGGDDNGKYHGKATKDYGKARAEDPSAVKARILAGMRKRETVGWKPTCECPEHEPIPCAVVDPFGGSGTTGRVALEEGRSVVLCELNSEYEPLIRRRCMVTPKLALEL